MRYLALPIYYIRSVRFGYLLAFIMITLLSLCYLQIFNFKIINTFVDNTFSEKEFNIFFVETNPNRSKFTLREICAIESAALNHPEAKVYVYSLNALLDRNLISTYKNIKFVLTTPEKIFKKSPMEPWWASNKKELVEKVLIK